MKQNVKPHIFRILDWFAFEAQQVNTQKHGFCFGLKLEIKFPSFGWMPSIFTVAEIVMIILIRLKTSPDVGGPIKATSWRTTV